MQGYYAPARRNFEEDIQFYEGDFEGLVTLPEGYALTIPSTLRAVVDEAIDNIMPHDIQVNYPPRGVSKKAEEDADSVRRFLRGLYRHWRRNGSDIDFLRDFGKNLFMSGFGCLKMVPDYTLWPVLPKDDEAALKAAGGTKLKERVKQIKELRERHTPLICRSLPPLNVLLDPVVGGRKLWLVEMYECSTEEVQDMYAKYEPDFRQVYRFTNKHRIWEIWTATHANWKGEVQEGRHWVFCDERLLNAEDDDQTNPYGDLPYVPKYSGHGRESHQGAPETKSVGFYTKQVKSLGKAEARRLSQLDAMVAQLAFPIGILPMSVDPDTFDTSPGAMNFVPDEVLQNSEKIWLKAPIPDAAIVASLRTIGSQIERGTTQAALRGAAVPGTDSASQLGLYTSQSKLRLDSVQQAMEDAVAQLFSMALRYIDQTLKDKVSVFVAEKDTARYTLGPGQIQGRYDVSVTFMPNEEQVKERKLALASDAIVKGGMSPYDALVFAGFENASEIIERRFAYDIMQEPLIKRSIGRDMLKEWGIDADAVELEEQMEMGMAQKMLSDFMNALATGSMRGAGDPMTPTGSPPGGGPPPGGGMQDPMAALAQNGQGPMPMAPGAPPQNPEFATPQMMQA